VYAVPLDRIDVLPVFVEEGDQTVEGHPIRDALPHDAKVVLMVGRLAIEKDMVTAFEAFARVIEAAPHTYLVIVGDGPLRPQLEKIASNEKFQGKVLFLGWQQNVYPYFRDADVFLFTSLYEGYGMVLIEAAVAGKGIVTTDVGIAKEFFGAQRAARVCPVGDSVCLGREVADLIAHDENRMLMGLRAQRIARSLYVSTLSEYTQKQVLIWKSMVKKQ
jgi:glycosyltransferase involved in cell wall biosynthesis